MSEALGLKDETLRSSSIKVRKGVMDKWSEELKNWNSVKISLSRIVGSKSRCAKLWSLQKGNFSVRATR
ncbi:hypothetical protein J1N35_018292 [Gossypium stocksii]|uniref:Uncharacterized protein n=1 Tax=Gossypium stocksii TaxID=47602 RepID=A0A9D3VQA7_9ROSI|nr:hypothetical protein J1N35_018292 [Gossypium stocksii]